MSGLTPDMIESSSSLPRVQGKHAEETRQAEQERANEEQQRLELEKRETEWLRNSGRREKKFYRRAKRRSDRATRKEEHERLASDPNYRNETLERFFQYRSVMTKKGAAWATGSGLSAAALVGSFTSIASNPALPNPHASAVVGVVITSAAFATCARNTAMTWFKFQAAKTAYHEPPTLGR